jgi:AbrB family looped-hinge helix DNA binding protein
MIYTSTISSRGQMTLPKALREVLGLSTTTRVNIYEEGGKITVREPVPLKDLHKLLGKPMKSAKLSSTEKSIIESMKESGRYEKLLTGC